MWYTVNLLVILNKMENNTGSHGVDCKGICCGAGVMNNRHNMNLLRRFFYLALLIVVFCFGTQLGELRAMKRMMWGGSHIMSTKHVKYMNNGGMMNTMLEGSGTLDTNAPIEAQ
jgi:hypothetical protein